MHEPQFFQDFLVEYQDVLAFFLLVFRKKTIMTIGDVYFVMRFEIKKN
jgi:hypothetical protein